MSKKLSSLLLATSLTSAALICPSLSMPALADRLDAKGTYGAIGIGGGFGGTGVGVGIGNDFGAWKAGIGLSYANSWGWAETYGLGVNAAYDIPTGDKVYPSIGVSALLANSCTDWGCGAAFGVDVPVRLNWEASETVDIALGISPIALLRGTPNAALTARFYF